MRAPGTPTVDQLLVLVAVAEDGSFTAAAARLGRVVSAVSYAIDTLEVQLGVRLFLRGSTRKPILTEAGAAVLAEARAVVHSVESLRARVTGLLDGLEAEVSLVVDSMYLGAHLTEVFVDFHHAFPTVPLRLLVQPLNGVERALRSGDAAIGVGSPLHTDLTGLRLYDVPSVRILPVAAPDHPLASPGAGPGARAADHIQLVLTDRANPDDREFGIVGHATWRVADQNLKHALLLRGIGWGGMPEPMVRADLGAGRLVRLQLDAHRGGDYPLQAIHRIETPPGPAGRWLIERLGVRPPEWRAEPESDP